jgi:hypothetical protein
VDLETFFSSLYNLTRAQWRVILALLICANLILYATLAWLWWAIVYPQLAPLEPSAGTLPTATLRPTYTPTWTPMVDATRTPVVTRMPES